MLIPSLINTIVEGDAREVLRNLPLSNSFDCVVTSPPYFNLREYTGLPSEIGTEESLAGYLTNLVHGVFDKVYSHLKNTGSLWVNIGDTFNKGQPLCVPWEFLDMMRMVGWQLRNIVIWYKPDSMAESTKRRFSQKWEPFFWFTKSDEYYFDFEAATIPVTQSTTTRLESKFNEGKGTDTSRMRGMVGDMSHKVERYLTQGVNAGDLWPIVTNKEKVAHIAPYPVELVVRPILSTCPPKGVVFDPFVGSGTTCLAVARIGGGRKYFGCDINPEAVSEACIRVEDETKQGKLF